MKYFVRVSVVLLIAVGIVFGFSYYYREKKKTLQETAEREVPEETEPGDENG